MMLKLHPKLVSIMYLDTDSAPGSIKQLGRPARFFFFLAQLV
jgi:hypothetical protein